jgi:holo-[acyl-carrier protein] synthase
MTLRVGIDLVAVVSVEEAISAHGDKYLKRVYTDRELEDCRRPGGIDPEALAARFAAKEAVLKLLRVGDQPVALRSIEVRREPDGAPTIDMTGSAATLAEEAGVADIAVSITHEDGYAAAVAVADVAARGNTQ